MTTTAERQKLIDEVIEMATKHRLEQATKVANEVWAAGAARGAYARDNYNAIVPALIVSAANLIDGVWKTNGDSLRAQVDQVIAAARRESLPKT